MFEQHQEVIIVDLQCGTQNNVFEKVKIYAQKYPQTVFEQKFST